MASDKSTPDIVIASCWQEYQMLNSLMLRLMEASSQVQIYAVVLLGGLVPLIQYIEGAAKSGGDPYILYLVAALIFSALGGYQIHLGNQVAEIDNYILLYLTPKVRNVIVYLTIKDENKELVQAISEEILGYHLYWRTIRYNRFLGIWFSLGVIGQTGLAVISTTGLFFVYIYYEYFYNPHPPMPNFWTIAFATSIGLSIVWMVISSVIVRFKYSTATQKYLIQYPQKTDYLHDYIQENSIKEMRPKPLPEKKKTITKKK